ncbi:hypothetical protein [Nocardia cyriacigeorgica]|uniref:Uncharacterized protein n=1 Tax=Nocardia cyriacigeorgica TaxID=135487 RepID=A0A4U8VVR2_9NOCA|nr:hypothetical protein [Nocardia cyriacigeorgica]MBF6098709.1 hypothetical protein [Nocardia cyriacigeorgica]MBF6162463.1 hypothetical protein [Nocardia cyriacigeorgica]MBF6201422.1 hypothetical protein [Nocardia cyriacigeorgica]VFA97760.1 Uncharacterised protein [Nocardia cyriacigeorgica]
MHEPRPQRRGRYPARDQRQRARGQADTAGVVGGQGSETTDRDRRAATSRLNRTGGHDLKCLGDLGAPADATMTSGVPEFRSIAP